ncbi:MAG: hypothetical protein ACK5N8_06980 [Alphaproteobacteria bacterium]
MKKIVSFLYLFTAVFLLSGIKNADALIIDKILKRAGTPTTKLTTIVPKAFNSVVVTTTVTTVKSSLDTIKEVKKLGGVNFKNLDEVGSAISSLNVGKTGATKINTAAKKITESKVADIYDEKSVSNAVYKLFLVQPSSDEKMIICYNEQRELFYKDTVAEIYTIVREVEKKLPEIEKELAATEELLKNGGGAVGDLDSNQVALDVGYQSSELLDRVVRMTEELTALQLQFEMTVAMQDSLVPLTKKEADEIKNSETKKTEKTSSLWLGNKFASSSQLVFAQLSKEDDFDMDKFTTYEAKKAPESNIKSPFAGSENSLDAVKNIAELKRDLTDALVMHNVSTSLSSYRDIFNEYEKMKKLHTKSLEMLSYSDQCAIDYLGKYYNNSEQVWSGGDLGALVNQENMRKGISKWLIDTYQVAKAQLVTDTASLEDSVSATLDSSIDVKNMDNAQKGAEKHVASQDLENSLSGSQLDEYNITGRSVQMLPWKVGAEISKSLAQDQYNEQKWGIPVKPFPLWNDQKKFYDLYIDSKYTNIVDYFNYADLRDVELGIAKGINKEKGEEADAEYKKQSAEKNGKWYNNLMTAASSGSYKRADTDEEWYVDARNKILGMAKNEKTLSDRKEELRKKKQTKEVIAELADISQNESWLKNYKTALEKVITVEELAQALSSELDKVREKEDTSEKDADEIYALFDKEILQIRAEREAAMLPYNVKIENNNKELKEVKTKISNYNKAINIEEEAKIEAQEGETTYKSTLDTVSLNKTVTELKKTREKLEKAINEDVAKVKEVKNDYDKKLADKEQELQEKLNRISDSYKDSSYASITDVLNDGLKAGLKAKATGAPDLIANLAKATSILTEIRNYAADAVSRTRNAIFALDEELYYPRSNPLVVEEHKKMIEELKSISYDKFTSFASKLDISTSLFKIAVEAVNKYLISQVCGDDSCLVVDDDYFVGIVSKARDFKAPKSPFVEFLPPVREAFYFDAVNYENLFNNKNYVDAYVECSEMNKSGDIVSDVKVTVEYKKDPLNPLGPLVPVQMCKFKKYYVSKTEFLESETYLPQVWQRVLTGRAFVERDINLKDFLSPDTGDNAFKKIATIAENNAAANADFLRGGRYPCQISGVVVDVSDAAKYVIPVEAIAELPTCQNISLDKRSYYYNVRDIENDVTTSIGNGETQKRFSGSELGFIFSSDEKGYLFFKNTVQSVFERVVEINKKVEEGKEHNPDMKDIIYGNSLLNVSQFGDFLDMAANEKEYLKNEQELKIAVDEAKEALFSALRATGLEPQEDLNLANDEDYNLVKRTLHSKKVEIINDVMRKAQSYKDLVLNEVVSERMDEITSLSTSLIQDNEEVVSLSFVPITSADLAEKIKTEEVNAKVRESHKKQADEAFAKELERMVRPYCASY